MSLRQAVRASWILPVALVVLGACRTDQAPAGPPNVLVLTVDTLRADYLSRNGYDRPTTPTLDALIAKGTYFDAITPVPRTTPAVASLFTAVYPQDHRVRELFDTLPDDVPTLPEAYSAAGYATLAVVSNHVLVEKRAIHRGFDIYDHADDGRHAAKTTSDALARVADVPQSKPLFLWVHYIDPHVPYHPSEALAREFDPGYDGRYPLNFGTAGAGVGDKAYPDDLWDPLESTCRHASLSIL